MNHWIKHGSGVHLIHLTGSRLDRARQHAEVLAKFDDCALRPLSEKNRTLIQKALPDSLKPILGPILTTLYSKVVSGQIRMFGPRAAQKELDAFVTLTGKPKEYFLESLTQPDWMMILASLVNPRFARDLPGCSSVVVTGKNAARGNLIHGRNMDYPAAGIWEKNSCVFYHEPFEPKSQAFVAFASLGVHTPGLTGMNDAGITVGVHAHFAKKISLTGMPILFLGQSILESARNLNDAIDLARRFPVMGNWTYVIGSAFENRAIAIELHQGQVHVREANEFSLCHSNNFHHPEFSHEEIELCGAIHLDMIARFESLYFSTREKKGLWNEEHVAMALANHQDPFLKQNHIFGNTVSVVTTIKSAIMEPALGRFFLSVRDESPTGHGPYVELPIRWDPSLAAQPRSESVRKLVPDMDVNFRNALHHYHKAYVAWQVPGNLPNAKEIALQELRKATDSLTTDPHLWIQRGIFELKCAKDAESAEIARSCLQRALQFSIHPYVKQVAQLFLARSLDLLGHRSDAQQIYTEIASTTRNKKLKKRATEGLKRQYQFKTVWKIDPDLQFVEPIDY